MEREEQAEIRYLEEWQEEVEVEAAREAWGRANDRRMAPAAHLDTENEQEEWSDSD